MKNYAILLFFSLGMLMTRAAATDKVVIQSLSDTYRFVPDKTGKALDRVEHTSKTTFRATEANATAAVLAYYDDYITIDKTSADKKIFGPYIPDDIFFSDSKACILGVNIPKSGTTKDISYRRTFTRPELFTSTMIYEPYEVESGELIFEIPASLAERYSLVEHHFPEGEIDKASETRNGVIHVKYTYKNLKKNESAVNAPSLHLTAPSLLVLGHFKDTDELYNYLYSCLPKDDPGAGTVAAKAIELTQGCTSDAERIATVTDFVHNTVRYVAVENGELGHRPDLASEVLRKAYGDCKGSAILIRDMLRSLGIDARIVWLGTDVIDTPWTDVPNISSGNHMIAAVVEGDSVKYIDGTFKYSSPGELALSESGVQTIIEGDANTHIIGMTPKAVPEQYPDSAAWVVDVGLSEGMLTYTGSLTVGGMQRKALMSTIDDTPVAKREALYERWLSHGIKGGKVSSMDCSINDDAIVLSGVVAQSNAVKSAGDQILVDVNPSQYISDLRFGPTDRKVPGMVKRTARTVVTIRLNVPEGLEPEHLPKDVAVSNQWLDGTVTNKMAPDGRSVVRKFTLVTRRGIVPVDALKLFNDDVRQLSRACSANIVLRKP